MTSLKHSNPELVRLTDQEQTLSGGDVSERPCRRCGAADVRTFNVLHHLVCAYVGPEYDFKLNENNVLICPKCLCPLRTGDKDWEMMGRSYRCEACSYEDV